MIKQFTSSVYIIDKARILLLFHQKLQKWLPPGGHLEENETPVEAAQREVKEETGLEIIFWQEENIWVKEHNAVSFLRPYLCLLENIPAYKDLAPHQHIDFVYVAIPAIGQDTEKLLEPCKWFSMSEIENLVLEKDIFKETRDVIVHLLKKSI